ncbi:GPW/gp25 family protein [Arhodomonas aquaeolei]|uniref:GPW/gp25 family protein n=1 Tax=Arhodomonas aquaeolei TaxID=2369 RepID=UPI00216A03D8|nr:GPW/gp25 family protein [Arhodomonas aquaeolei]MCS4503908.1 GPW/gp25 family protein [Arhodomonas aquaeolei]
MAGMHRHTGEPIDGVAELRQQVRDVLETPIGSRVMLRGYGSRLFELLDEPVDQRFEVEVYAAVAEAVREWVPRFSLERVRLVEVTERGPVFDLYGVDLETGRGVVLEGV